MGNMPKLRFGEFSDDWRSVTLEQIATKITDGTHDTPKAVSEGVPYITAIHVKDGFIDFDNCYFLPQIEHDKIYKRCNPEKGDLLIVNIGAGTATTARVAVDYPFSLKNVALVKLDRSMVSTEFVSQIQRKNASRLHHMLTSGGAQPFLSLKQIGKIPLEAPSIAEQQKIATFLSAVDTKIEQLTHKEALLKQYKKGVMQKIFSQEIRFKADDGSEFPEWRNVKLSQVADIVGGGTPDTSIAEYWDGEINWFTPTEIKTKYLGHSGRKISDQGLAKSSAKLLPVGSLLLSTRATVGDIGISTVPCTTNQGFQSLVVNDQNDHEFVYYWICFNKRELIRRASGSTFLEIGKKEISKIIVQRPSLEEQSYIARFLQSIDAKLMHLADQLASAKTFKKGLLQQMFV